MARRYFQARCRFLYLKLCLLFEKVEIASERVFFLSYRVLIVVIVRLFRLFVFRLEIVSTRGLNVFPHRREAPPLVVRLRPLCLLATSIVHHREKMLIKQ